MQHQPTDSALFSADADSYESAKLYALRDIYLSVGLPLEHAQRSAQADYVCQFQRETSCAA